MEKEVVECDNFKAGFQPALRRALNVLIGNDELLRMKDGEILLPDGRRIRCEAFFDETNFDNLCVRCVILD